MMQVEKATAKDGLSGLASVLRDAGKSKQDRFLELMKDFPCSFNIGHADINIDDGSDENVRVEEPQVPKELWKYIIGNNIEDDDENDFEEPYWKENLLTRAYKEVGPRQKARKLNHDIVRCSKDTNLVALANKAFLHYFDGQMVEAYTVIEQLQSLKSHPTFRDLKIDAVSEQAFSFRKFGGAQHLLASVTLLRVTLRYRPLNEKLQLMEAMVLRRSTHFNIYSEDPKRIDRSQVCLDAATALYRIGTQAKSKRIRAAAMIQLAYLRYNDDCDDKYSQRGKTPGKPMLDRNVWCGIVGSSSWKMLCDEAIKTEDDPSEKVLKIAGQLYRYADGHENLKESERLLLRAIEKKPTTRAHHHLALTYRKMAVSFERNSNPQRRQPYQRSCSEIREDSRLSVLPEPPEDTRPKATEYRLFVFTKIPKQNLKPFRESNSFAQKVVQQLILAVEISYRQNRSAVFDLAMMYAQMGKYDESLKVCQILIDDSTAEGERVQRPLVVISTFNLYGMCCAMKAEQTTSQTIKENLLNEAENMFMYAVRMASQLASEIPELKTCASDLWVAFETLERKFKFNGSKSSQDKLFTLCGLVADYRKLQIFDEIMSMGKFDYLTPESLENCLSSYINMKDFKSALMCNEMIPLRTGGMLEKLTWCASVTMQKLMLGYAEQLLSKSPLQLDNSEYLIQRLPVWKEMFYQEFLNNDNENSKLFDVVIVQDVGEDWQPRPGSLSDTAAKVLKDVLEKVCGLRVARAHEDADHGQKFHEECEIISHSHMAIFVLADDEDTPCKQLDFPDNAVPVMHMERGCGSTWSRQSDEDVTENTLVKQFNSGVSLHDDEKDKKDELTSAPFNFIFNCCTVEYVENKQPAHIVLITVGDCHVQLQALPPLLRSFRSSGLSLTEEDIVNLSRAPTGQISDQSCDLIMKLFKAIVRKNDLQNGTC